MPKTPLPTFTTKSRMLCRRLKRKLNKLPPGAGVPVVELAVVELAVVELAVVELAVVVDGPVVDELPFDELPFELDD